MPRNQHTAVEQDALLARLIDTIPDTFDPTDQHAVAAYIDAHGLEAFRTERQRQTGYTEG